MIEKWILSLCLFFLVGIVFSQEYGKIFSAEDLKKEIKTESFKTIIINKKIEVKEKIEVPENIDLIVLKEGGFIKKSEEGEIFIKGNFNAPISQVFYNFSPGEVKFNKKNIKEVYPQWWGAKADGNFDDSYAIQSAIDSGVCKVFLPCGRYYIGKTLNITNIWNGLTIEGVGNSEDDNNCSLLIGGTGGIVMDCSGSRYLYLKNFRIKGAESNPSTVGIYFARTKDVQFAEFNTIENVSVFLPHIVEANNGNGTVGIYNYTAELWRARNIHIDADNGVVFTGYNIFKIFSPYREIWTGYPSMSECSIDGTSTIKGNFGPAILIDNGIKIEILNAYLSGGCPEKDKENFCPYTIKIGGHSFWNSHITITGHIERMGNGVLFVESTNITNLKLDVSSSFKGPLIHLKGGSISDSEISILHYERYPSRERSFFAIDSEGSIKNTTFMLEYPQDKFIAPKVMFKGVILKGAIPIEEIKKNLKVKEGSSFLLIGEENFLMYNIK
jgi:hypothetical protein